MLLWIRHFIKNFKSIGHMHQWELLGIGHEYRIYECSVVGCEAEKSEVLDAQS